MKNFSNYEGRLGHALKANVKMLNAASRDKQAFKNLMDVCIASGLIPEAEKLANQLKAEADRNFTKAYAHAYDIFMKGDGYGVIR